MNLSNLKRLFPACACAMALAGVAAPTIAKADVVWTVSGTFDDGGALSGVFDINQYGYLESFDLTTTGGATLGGFEYTPSDSYFSNGVFYVDAQPGYQSDLHLAFSVPLTTAEANDAIIGGEGGPSYECANSFSCYLPQGGSVRYVAAGFASAASGGVPEPAAWLLMIVGFGGAGAVLRAHRRRRAIA